METEHVPTWFKENGKQTTAGLLHSHGWNN